MLNSSAIDADIAKFCVNAIANTPASASAALMPPITARPRVTNPATRLFAASASSAMQNARLAIAQIRFTIDHDDLAPAERAFMLLSACSEESFASLVAYTIDWWPVGSAEADDALAEEPDASAEAADALADESAASATLCNPPRTTEKATSSAKTAPANATALPLVIAFNAITLSDPLRDNLHNLASHANCLIAP